LTIGKKNEIFNLTMKNHTDKLIQALLDSYKELGGINHLEGPNLPSRQSISKIIDDFESLIFPGFRDEANLDLANMKYVMGEKLTRITKNLIIETEKSLRYACKLQAQCCADTDNATLPAECQLDCRRQAEEKVLCILGKIPAIRCKLRLDVEAAFAGDPAAKSHEEVMLSYPGVEAVICYRIAHEFWQEQIPLIPRMMSEYIHSKTGIDIHPGAHVGQSFFIDHGTGVVIGQTTDIGDRVRIYQGVTLGALSLPKDAVESLRTQKRHPTIEDDVIIYSGATILGGETVIGARSVIGGNVWITESVPADTKVF
jgi:serine O-acetyltransferase